LNESVTPIVAAQPAAGAQRGVLRSQEVGDRMKTRTGYAGCELNLGQREAADNASTLTAASVFGTIQTASCSSCL
jgi:hypothetical protein